MKLRVHNLFESKPSEKMPKRLYSTKANVATEFKLQEAIEYLSLIEHTAAIAEKEKRIEALEAALRFYAEGGGSLNSDYSCVNCDNTKELQVISGHKAREALAASAKGE